MQPTRKRERGVGRVKREVPAPQPPQADADSATPVPQAVSDDGSVEVMLLRVEETRGVVPVVRFVNDGRRAKNLKQHTAWMLQTLLGASARADSLYEHVRCRDLEEGTESLGIPHEDVYIAQLNYGGYPPYKGIGASGERSAMLALIIRLTMAEKTLPRSFWESIEPYGLASVLNGFLDQLKRIIIRIYTDAEDEQRLPRLVSASSVRSSSGAAHLRREVPRRGLIPPECPRQAQGIELWIVNELVPVINIQSNANQMFCEHVAWLLQTAMGSEAKAKDLMTYVSDFDEWPETRQTYDECVAKIGLNEQVCGMVKLKGLGTQVLAVGAAGKRSSMLAAVIAIAIQDDRHLVDLEPQIERSVPDLVEPFFDLIRCAVELQEREYPLHRTHTDLHERREENRPKRAERAAAGSAQPGDASRQEAKRARGSFESMPVSQVRHTFKGHGSTRWTRSRSR